MVKGAMFITPDHHPEWVKPITSTPDRIVEAANATFQSIHQRPYRAVTVHLPQEDLTESFEIAKNTLEQCLSGSDDKITINFTPDEIFDITNRLGDTLHSQIDINSAHLILGPAFARQLRFNMQLGSGRMEITAHDGDNTQPHIDSTGQVTEDNRTKKAPEHGITVTSSIKRNGTDLVDIIDGELDRQASDFGGPNRRIWTYSPLGNIDDRTWHTEENTIVVVRSKDWDKARLPCPHKSAFRTKDNDPETGIVARSFIRGLG